MICPKTKSATHSLTELFPIYQNKYWTIRQQDDHSVNPLPHCIILKIVGFYKIISELKPTVTRKFSSHYAKTTKNEFWPHCAIPTVVVPQSPPPQFLGWKSLKHANAFVYMTEKALSSVFLCRFQNQSKVHKRYRWVLLYFFIL